MDRLSCRGRCGAARRTGMLAPVILLSGCAVGIVSVRTPERLPAESLPPLTRRVSFDVCIPPGRGPLTPAQIEHERKTQGDRIHAALSRAGVEAELTSSPGSPARFTVTERVQHEHVWSGLLSFFTLSVIPGYVVDRRTLDVDLALGNPAQAGTREHLEYETRASTFIWVPLIVYPDVFVGINGGWVSAKGKDAGFEGTVQRLADDLRHRLGRGEPDSPWSEVDGVVCPSPTGRTEPARPEPR